MAITVKHSKVSTIPDDADTSLVRPSDWNADHTLTGTIPVDNGGTGASTLTGYVKGNGTAAMTASATVPSTDVTGLGTMSTQNSNNISVTGGSMNGVTISDYVATATKGVANGVASLDGSGTVPISQLPAAVLGALSYQGTWNASTNTPTLTSSVGTKGYYYVVSVAGSTNLNGITDWVVGDWAVYNGTAWQKVDNTDAVTSVNGYTGTVVLTNTDISGFGTMSTQNANAVAITGGAIDGTTIGATTTSTGKFTTLNASTSLTTPIVQASNSGGLSLKNSAGTTQISMGAGGGDNASINVSTNINGTNAQIDISPTGTGHVHINPSGIGSVEIKPTNVGTMDNITIGATTPKAITGTTITATSFVGSGASLTNVVNSLAASTGISVSGSTGAVTVTNTAPDQTVALTAGTGISTSGTYPNFTITNTAPSSGGTVTSVTGTAPVVSSGGNTPAISMPAATTSVNGYLTSTDWNTFNNKGSGTVTSVSGTAPVVSSGGATPAISMAAATGSVNGYLTSTDWTTFNNKGSGTVTSVATGTGLTGGPVTSSGTISLANTAVTPAAYTNANITVDAQGRITSASNGSGGSGTVTSVAATVPSLLSVSGSPITTSGTLAFTYSGTALPVANGGTGLTSTPTNGQIDIGNGTGFTRATLTAGNGISITNASGAITVSNSLAPYSASYLIVAGGGGAGQSFGAGGGGGGVVSGTTTFTVGNVYTATVGAGGAYQTNTTGGNSSLTGLTTAVGGGCGGGSSYPTGTAGGSGGGGRGGASPANGGAGTSGQGNAGGNGTSVAAGGGGGAGAVGVTSGNTQGGAGGAGVASSITGTSIYYAGGGSGNGIGGGQTPQSGGTVVSTAGAANSGAGAGGDNSVNGGSGVVIISVPTSSYSGTTTGSPTITTSGSNTIITFTGSGSYTA